MREWLVPVALLSLSLAVTAPASAQSRRGELRGAWMGEGYGRDWPAIMKSLKDNGFNAIFPNFSVGNMALYPSKTLTVLPGAEPGRDELAEAVKAAKSNGIELHVWRINWALWRTPPELLAELDAAGRLQRNSRGQRAKDDPEIAVDWLCPSNPENRKLEKETMVELVRDYDLAGIQFDYMRFPGSDYCFCDGCKERFQRSQDVKVERWPEDVIGEGPLAAKWQQWRRDLISSLVGEISDAAHALKPDICVSLAAWSDLADGREAYAQDWTSWARDGVLDFVCPMDYTLDREHLAGLLRQQVGEVRGTIPVYAGLAAYQMKSAWPLIQQVETARASGADGFVAFAYGSGQLAEWLPELRAGVTVADPNPMPHRSPPARLAMTPAAASAPAGDFLEIEITLGWEPPALTEDEGAAADAQAGAMLRRAMGERFPLGDYDDKPDIAEQQDASPRLSGRIIAETPDGAPIAMLGAFDSTWKFERKLRFAAPEGPFRVAIYGTVSTTNGRSDFVVRTPLVAGVKEVL
jgi:uncharacterized lipoprotein YddW (UPF0748 family)